MIKAKNKYHVLAWACALVILVNLGVKFWVMAPLDARIRDLETKVADLGIKRPVHQDQKADPMDDITQNMEKLLKAIPPKHQLTESAAFLRDLIDQNSLVPQAKLAFDHEKGDPPFLLKYHSRVLVNGQYENIKKFLADLQNMPGLSVLNTVRIVRIEQGNTQLRLSLGISMFFRENSR